MARSKKNTEKVVEQKDVSLAQRKKDLDNFCESFNKGVGKVVFGRLSENPELLKKLIVEYIETPSRRVNAALGGGWPRGKMSIVSGFPDSGKTLYQLETIALNQKKDPNFIGGWIETEHSITMKDIEMFGIDTERFYFFDTENKLSGEQIFDMINSALLTQKIDMLVVNSIKNLLSQSELDGSISDQQIGASARMLSKICRKTLPVIADTNTALIFIQTLSTEIGKLFGNPMQMSGGYAIRYNASIIVEHNNLTIVDKDPIKKDEGRKIGFTVKKNHVCSNENPYKKEEYFVIYGQGTDRLVENIEFAEKCGFVLHSGSFYKLPDEDGNPQIRDGEKMQWQGLNNFRNYCLNNPAFVEEMEQAINNSNISIESESLTEDEIKEIESEEKTINNIIENSDKDDIIEKASEEE